MKTKLCYTLIFITFFTLAFVPNTFAQDTAPEYVLRVVYFVPKDREPDPNMNTKLDTMVKDIQKFYADEMERHGFGRKTFNFETDENGNVKVHHVKGIHNDADYISNDRLALEEIREQFDLSKNIHLFAFDYSLGTLGSVCGKGKGDSRNGSALVSASGRCFEFTVIAHELGHAFGLQHDFRSNTFIMSYWADRNQLSRCAAEWLDEHRYFNPKPEDFNWNFNVEMLTPSLASPPANIRLRFEVTDPDGLHQAQLQRRGSGGGIARGYYSLIDCQKLSGQHATVEFVTDDLLGGNTEIKLQVMDMHGNFVAYQFTIDITDLLPPSEVISIPDPNLASAVREAIGLAPETDITQFHLLQLEQLTAFKRQITDLTGLQHAIRIHNLRLSGNQISDITPIAGLTQLKELSLYRNQISDITPIAGLTNLSVLEFSSNQISDITPIAGLTQLSRLFLEFNQISDVSPLAELKNLHRLELYGNQISDVSPLGGLVNLKFLSLVDNPIKSRKPLFDLLQNNPDVKIYLKPGGKPLPVTLSYFRAEYTDTGVILKWTTESEVDNAGFYIYRSPTKDGEFKVVNPTMIQGAGTTGERNNYTWTDTTAKPNTVYYYRIEDVSHAGVREQLATVRLRGLISASGKLATSWAGLKAQN